MLRTIEARPPYVVGNIKENGLDRELHALLESFAGHRSVLEGKTVILCVPHNQLKPTAAFVKQEALPIFVGAQYVSRFPGGSHTGEVSAAMIAEDAQFTLAGHSERRALGETDEIVIEQVRHATEANLATIFCASNVDQVRFLKEHIPTFDGIILLEDPSAISTGQPDNLANQSKPLDSQEANRLAGEFKKLFPNVDIIYGGSVDKDNVERFMEQEYFTGYIVGARSLNASFFLPILEKT